MERIRKPGIGLNSLLLHCRRFYEENRINIALALFAFYVYFIRREIWLELTHPIPFLPFLEGLSSIPSNAIKTSILGILTSAFISLFLFRKPLVFACLSGISVMCLLLCNKALFSNSLLFAACMLFLFGFYRGKDHWFRVQIGLLYLGASINKAFDPDWWNGVFMHHMATVAYPMLGYQQVYQATHSLLLAKALGIFTIATEWTIGILVFFPRHTRLLISLGILLHGGMFIMLQGRLSFHFLYLILCSYLLLNYQNKKRPGELASPQPE